MSLDQTTLDELQEIAGRYPQARSGLLPMLHLVQSAEGRVTAEGIEMCAEILGITSQVLDNHDGELMPTLENRRTLTRLIREWKADLVISHRPNDYHPDHRYTAQLVQDAAFMVIVPNFCPDVPALRKNPTFLYSEDRFQKRNPFQADVVVPIDSVLDQKARCYAALESQYGDRVPVLLLGGIDGREVCHYHLDRARLARALSERG